MSKILVLGVGGHGFSSAVLPSLVKIKKRKPSLGVLAVGANHDSGGSTGLLLRVFGQAKNSKGLKMPLLSVGDFAKYLRYFLGECKFSLIFSERIVDFQKAASKDELLDIYLDFLRPKIASIAESKLEMDKQLLPSLANFAEFLENFYIPRLWDKFAELKNQWSEFEKVKDCLGNLWITKECLEKGGFVEFQESLEKQKIFPDGFSYIYTHTSYSQLRGLDIQGNIVDSEEFIDIYSLPLIQFSYPQSTGTELATNQSQVQILDFLKDDKSLVLLPVGSFANVLPVVQSLCLNREIRELLQTKIHSSKFLIMLNLFRANNETSLLKQLQEVHRLVCLQGDFFDSGILLAGPSRFSFRGVNFKNFNCSMRLLKDYLDQEKYPHDFTWLSSQGLKKYWPIKTEIQKNLGLKYNIAEITKLLSSFL